MISDSKGQSASMLYDTEYLPAMRQLLRDAQYRFWVHVFSVNPRVPDDEMLLVRQWLQELSARARRGLDVRVLLGGNARLVANAPGGVDDAIPLMTALGLPTRTFKSKGDGSHSKSIVVDGDSVMIGSHHWTSRALGLGGDTSVLVRSKPLNSGLAREFLEHWSRAEAHEYTGTAKDRRLMLWSGWQGIPGIEPLPDAEIPKTQAIAQGVLLPGSSYLTSLLASVAKARQSIDVSMFYFASSPSNRHPTSRLLQALIAAHKRGLAVSVRLDQDQPGDRYRSREINGQKLSELRKAGIPAKFDRPDKVNHSKVVVIDKTTVFVGSHNWTGRSLKDLQETSVRFDSTPIAASLAKRIRVSVKRRASKSSVVR